jgi:hypothetical protein
MPILFEYKDVDSAILLAPQSPSGIAKRWIERPEDARLLLLLGWAMGGARR